MMLASYSSFYMLHIIQSPEPKARWLEGEQMPPAIDVPVPETVSADLVYVRTGTSCLRAIMTYICLLQRYTFLSTLWRFQKCPVIAADQGLMKMSQTLLDRCLAIAMPDRPLTSKTSRPRRASLSTVQDIRARPRPPRKLPFVSMLVCFLIVVVEQSNRHVGVKIGCGLYCNEFERKCSLALT